MRSFFKSGYHNSFQIYVILFLLIFSLINIRQHRITNFDCEICSDKAGYYMFLPAVFHNGFNTENYPESFDQEHGLGFRIDRQNNRLITKFTCGIAILQSPFYAMGSIIAKTFSLEVSPYSKYYMFFINIGAAFYIVMGLYFFRKWLNYYAGEVSSFWTILVTFFGTNLYYYTLDESLMSHMYSFSLFSILLFGSKSFYETKKFKYFLLFVIPLSFAILIRPTNILFAVIAPLTDVNSFKILKSKLKLLLTPKNIAYALFFFLLIMSPQLFYWKYAYGKYIVWSYTGEGFTLWNRPQFLTVWFSPQSGLFTYTPLILLSLVFSVIMYIKKERNSMLVIFTFLVTSYMCASWSNPQFGVCNFGKRPMVEYLPILMFPISYMFDHYKSYPGLYKHIPLIALIFFVYYNQALFVAFNTCFFGETWEWSKFGLLLKNAFLLVR